MTVVCRWVDSSDGQISCLHGPDGKPVGRIVQSGVRWVAWFDDKECGVGLTKVGAQIIVANARVRKLLPDRIMASELLKDAINKRLKVDRV